MYQLDSVLTCRQYAREEHLEEDLHNMLPRDEGVETPAQQALRQRM